MFVVTFLDIIVMERLRAIAMSGRLEADRGSAADARLGGSDRIDAEKRVAALAVQTRYRELDISPLTDVELISLERLLVGDGDAWDWSIVEAAGSRRHYDSDRVAFLTS